MPASEADADEVIGVLGKGGMGEVYRGVDTRLNRGVAIKVSEERFTDRFNNEAHAISSLYHPHVCTLYDVGPNYLAHGGRPGPLLSPGRLANLGT